MKRIYLDIEDTLTTPNLCGWQATQYLPENIALIEAFIRSVQPDTLGLFSFALGNDQDYEAFRRSGSLRFLEQQFGMGFRDIPFVEGIVGDCAKVTGINGDLPLADVVSFWGKGGSFKLWVQEGLNRGEFNSGDEFWLIDDSVLDEEVVWPTLDVKVTLINVNSSKLKEA